jgi:hypothetical protein
MNAKERYSREFAKILYKADNLDCLSDIDRYQIHRIFDRFKPKYHDLIAEYPLWIAQLENVTPRDLRRARQQNSEGKGSMFLFSHARIEAYVRRHL